MTKTILYCDTETYSETPISDGTYAYAADAEVMIFTYAINDGPVKTWDATLNSKMPEELRSLLNADNVTYVWHNSMFDRNVLRYALQIDLPTDKIHDVMVIALMHGLPGGLDKLCDIFKVSEEEGKLKEGRRLINLFCKPRPQNQKLRRATRETHAADWERFIKYAEQDIVAMRAIYRKIPTWNFDRTERQLWCLDQKINDRGFLVDVELAEKAIATVNREQKRLARRTNDITEGDVKTATQRDKMLAHILREYGVDLPDMTKATLERRLNDETLPDPVRELIAIRLNASTASVSKYKKLVRGVNDDNRLRGTLQFCGASRTGRWAGRTFQPQNLPRPTHSQQEVDRAIDFIKADCLDIVSRDTMKLCSSVIRGCIVAPPGKKLVIADLSNIEGRVAAWLANEKWKLKAFEDFDTGEGDDLYKLAYARSFNVDPSTVDKDKRQLGKVQELALGYGGGVGAFVTMVQAYGIDLNQLTEATLDSLPRDVYEEAQSFFNYQNVKKKTYGLDSKVFIVCDALKRLWRNAHPAISSYWDELEQAARNAIANNGKPYQCRRVIFHKEGAWLLLKLPSGRSLCYPSARIDDSGSISYLGVNPYSRQWGRITTYGGKIFENICQAVARDVMAHNMPKVEQNGFNILLTVHDELITEALDDDEEEHTEGWLSWCMATPPQWAQTLPLAAGGFEAQRYRKD